MLRLVSSVRSRLIRAGAFRAAGAAVPGTARLGLEQVPSHRRYEAPRCFSSDAKDHDRPWRYLAVYSPVAWQETVKPALLTFLKLQKHLMVPVKFVVPHGDDAWPEAAWGYPLGKHGVWLRKQWREGGHRIVQKQLMGLEEMEFAWDWSQYKWDRFVLPGLRRFYELNGHTDVHREFCIPKGSPEWPEHLWGQRLGIKLSDIRHLKYFAKQVEADKEELIRLKFCHGSTLYDRDWREKVVPALRAFHQEFGHCNVSVTFTVPSQLPWPEAAWGMRLGKTVDHIRCGKLGANQDKRELDELGFVWDHFESEWSDRILPALENFHRLKGHCRMPKAFVVPSDENWPASSWGLKLGTIVNSIRNDGTYSTQVKRDTARLEELGFVWDFFESEWSEHILPALETFHRLNGHCRVPQSFVVPSDENWPTSSWSLKLGSVVVSIRSRGTYSTQVMRDKTRLEGLDFVWKVGEFEWSERILPALEAFHKVHGHCRVAKTFVIPPEATWPNQAHGLKLGIAVSNIRSRASYFDQIARSIDSLEAIEFDSKIAVSKWTARVEPILATFEQLHGHRNVPCDFAVPSTPPWREKDWGIQLGKLEPR